MSASVHAESVSVRRGDVTVLDDVDLTVNEGEMVVVLGPNGAGKTTLLRVMLGLESATSGRALVNGGPVGRLSGPSRAAKVGWLPQRGRAGESLTTAEVVAAARFRFPESAATSLQRAREALDQVGLARFADRTVDRLSGGESQRVALAALIAQDAAIWLADEPANHLDPAVQFAVYGLLRDQWLAGRGLMVVTHDVGLLAHLAPPERRSDVRVIGLKAGRVVVESVLSRQSLPGELSELFGIRVRSVEVDGSQHWVVRP